MKKPFFIAIIILIFYSCTNNSKEPGAQPIVENNKIDSFFPVTSFIRGQILTLDSLPVTPLQITTIGTKTDSAWLSKATLKASLLPFLEPLITETSLTKFFKETKFNDQTLNAITFTYDPISVVPDSISLRHWDVYVDPETGGVLKVYLVKSIKENNQLFTQQFTWQTNKMAKITSILNKPDGSMELMKENVFIWNFTPAP